MLKISFEKLPMTIVKLASANIPAGTKALNKTANQGRKRVREEMERVFDRPTAYALNSMFVDPATDQKQEAIIGIKGEGKTDKSKTKPVSFLSPEVYGGGRNDKKSEKAFKKSGLLAQNKQYVFGKRAPLDQYGNIRGSVMQQILAQTKSSIHGDQNETAKSRKRKKKKSQYFAAQLKDSEDGSKAIFQRIGSNIIPILIPINKPKYNKRLQFHEIIEKVYEQNIQKNFNDMLLEEWKNVIV